MNIYRYYISFNGYAGTYTEIFPSNPLQEIGERVDGSHILRKKLSEIKIGQFKNYAVYNLLESWFFDSTKFSTTIFIKVTKNAVVKHYHRFGVKWGKINTTANTYAVESEPYDSYGIYIEPFLDISTDSTYGGATIYHYDEDTTNHPVLTWSGDHTNVILEQFIKNKIAAITGLSSANIVSTFLFNDPYPDTTSPTLINGMYRNYVTNSYNRFKYGFIIMDAATKARDFTLKNILDLLQYVQVYYYFDSNGKLRFEHESYFRDEIDGTTVNLTIENNDVSYKYLRPEMPIVETINTADSTDDEDFGTSRITYGIPRNIVQQSNDSYSFAVQQMISSLIAETPGTFISLVAGYNNLAVNWIYKDFVGTITQHVFNIYALPSDIAYTSDIKVINGSVGITIVATTCDAVFTFYMSKRSNGVKQTGDVVISSPGTVSDTFTSPQYDDMYLVMECISGSGDFVGYVILTESNNMRSVWEAGEVSTDNKLNGPFCVANVLDKFWRDNRLSLSGNMNGSAETFDGTQYNLYREDIRLYYPDDIYALKGYNDGVMTGVADGYTRELDSDFVKINLKFEEIA